MNRKNYDRVFILCISILGITAVFPQEARADMGLPMIVLVWPGAWVLLLPIIMIETFMAHHMLQLDWQKAIKVTAAANAVSTIVGIPIAWLLLALPFWIIGAAGFLLKVPERLLSILMLPFYTLWLPPMVESKEWLIPLSALILCIPFFFASIRVETKIAGKMLKDLKNEDISRWVWKGNICSYSFIGILLLGDMSWLLLGH